MTFSEKYANWHGSAETPPSAMSYGPVQPVAEPGMKQQRVPVERTETQLLVSVCSLLGESLAELRHMRAEMREASATSRSSVQLEQGAKEVRLTVKTYDGSPVGPIGDEAIAEFGRLFRLIEQRQMAAWVETVEALKS